MTSEIHLVEKSVLNIDRAMKHSNQKLIRNKRVYCIYCEVLVSNFPRHLERNHSLESEVRSFITLPKKSTERLKNLELLKNKGNLYYNKNILKNKSSSPIVGRRPINLDKVNVNDYLPCTYCFKFFKKCIDIQRKVNFKVLKLKKVFPKEEIN